MNREYNFLSEVDARGRDAIAFGAFLLYPERRLLERDGVPIHLGSRAMGILIALAESAPEIVSSRDLIARVWYGLHVEDGNLRFHMAALRKALGEGQTGARYITNVPGQGYCFVAPISRSTRKLAGPGPADAADTLPAKLRRMVGRDADLQSIAAALNDQRFVCTDALC